MYGCAVLQADDLDEPAEYAESDSDWAPTKVFFLFLNSFECFS